MASDSPSPPRPSSERTGLLPLTFAALGIVFGDIGTSPLYALKTVLSLTNETPDRAVLMGALSLIVWTLFMVATVKYVVFAMRIGNGGEGGILALMSLLSPRLKPRHFITVIGLMGAALIYGDGAVTPAISILSALEGLSIIDKSFTAYILPLSVLILLGLFCLQSQGTARIGKIFGPVMLLWFTTIAAMGVRGILQHPAILAALNPYYGFHYLIHGGIEGFLVLGGVFLCVTGAEALYADMGHFGAKPIRVAWSCLVLPSLVLNYAGQTALILQGRPATGNVFYQLCPPFLLIPLILLSTAATIIASQSIITGSFSMTRQAIQLGWLPRMRVKQTSAEGRGQIYVGGVNWILMFASCGLMLAFKKSDNLAAAYGIAVSTTMLATSLLLFVAMREIWKWGWLTAGAAAGIFILIDLAFFTANLSKFAAGGYVPIVMGAVMFGVMLIWHRGAREVSKRFRETAIPVGDFLDKVARDRIQRVPGTAVFLTRTEDHAPPVMVWHVSHNRALHEHLLVLRVEMLATPWLEHAERLSVAEIAPGFWRATARFGFMEHPDIPGLIDQAAKRGCDIGLSEVTYYVGHETVIARDDKHGIPKWIEMVFALMQRNALHVSDYLRLPQESLVEIGRQVSI